MHLASQEELNWYWNSTCQELFEALGCRPEGLTSEEASKLLARSGPNSIKPPAEKSPIAMFLDKFKNPLIVILVFAVVVTMIVHDWLEASIVLAIIFGSTLLSTSSEYRASSAIKKLRQRVELKTTVVRDGKVVPCPATDVVPGDIVQVSAGSLVPADGILVEARNLFVSQALLTGETFPVEKRPGKTPRNATPAERLNCLFAGSSIRSGTGRFLVVKTGRQTVFGGIAQSLAAKSPETEFERGLRRFGALLLYIMVIIVVTIFFVNILLHRPAIDTLLFAVALAVGLSPEMFPVILSVTLSRGAQNMAGHGVIVKRLNAIENLGSMEVLCSDKTGTITEGTARLKEALGITGEPSSEVLNAAFLNSYFQAGLANPLDAAIIQAAEKEIQLLAKQVLLNNFLSDIPSVGIAGDHGDPLLSSGRGDSRHGTPLAKVEHPKASLPLSPEPGDFLHRRCPVPDAAHGFNQPSPCRCCNLSAGPGFPARFGYTLGNASGCGAKGVSFGSNSKPGGSVHGFHGRPDSTRPGDLRSSQCRPSRQPWDSFRSGTGRNPSPAGVDPLDAHAPRHLACKTRTFPSPRTVAFPLYGSLQQREMQVGNHGSSSSFLFRQQSKTYSFLFQASVMRQDWIFPTY